MPAITIVLSLGRWNSWNFFACNINETVIKETGNIYYLYGSFLLMVSMLRPIFATCFCIDEFTMVKLTRRRVLANLYFERRRKSCGLSSVIGLKFGYFSAGLVMLVP